MRTHSGAHPQYNIKETDTMAKLSEAGAKQLREALDKLGAALERDIKNGIIGKEITAVVNDFKKLEETD